MLDRYLIDVNVEWKWDRCYQRRTDSDTLRTSHYLKQSLQRRHNERDGVSNHGRLDCLLNRFFFRRRSKKTSKLRVTGLCEENPPVTGYDVGAVQPWTLNSTMTWNWFFLFLMSSFKIHVLVFQEWVGRLIWDQGYELAQWWLLCVTLTKTLNLDFHG